MSKGKISDGVSVPVVLAAAVLANGTVVQGDIVGVAGEAGGIGDTVTVHLKGVWGNVVKKAGTAWVQGDPLYWDATPGEWTKTAADGTYGGVAFTSALSAATTGEILLCPKPPLDSVALATTLAATVGKLSTTALVAGVLVVANTAITANSAVSVQRVVPGGTVSAGGYKVTLNAGVGYTITALQAAGSATETANTDTVCATIVY